MSISRKFNNSQLAKTSSDHNFASTLPSDADLAKSVYPTIEKAKQMRAKADARSQGSLYRELSSCYHVARYIVANEAAWEDFCYEMEIKFEPMPKSSAVLYAVLLAYTGDDLSGQKKASRYKRALQEHLKRAATASQVYASLKKGGVDKLLRERSGSGGSAAKKLSIEKPLRLTGADRRTFTLQAGGRRTLILTSKESARYTITVAKSDIISASANSSQKARTFLKKTASPVHTTAGQRQLSGMRARTGRSSLEKQ